MICSDFTYQEASVKTITATELARNLRQVLDHLVNEGEEIVVERNHREIARIVPGPGHQTALEAMSDLYRTLSPEAAAGWAENGRKPASDTVEEGVRDPWAS
jgi:antitoxin (DNA-binding transcriptional repressor) of toxin-antitoxin stability system